LPDRFARWECAAAAIIVSDNNDLSNNAVINFREVCHVCP